jgi:polyvinyl alcohol dehydrogenase (cytochrome)
MARSRWGAHPGAPSTARRTLLALAMTGAVLGGLLAPAPAAGGTASPIAGTGAEGDWPTWQKDLTGSRYAAGERRILPTTVGSLELAWAFAYPKIPNALGKSQPAIVGGVVYFGTPDSKVHALDAHTGATLWSFDLRTVGDPGAGPDAAAVWDGPSVTGDRVFIGDRRGYLYAFDRETGALRWSTRLDPHPRAKLTSSPIYYKGRVYVGVSSFETGAEPTYDCCTFRGHVDAVDARTGAVIWRYYTMPPAQPVGTWPSGAIRYEPSGGAVWGTPTIDPTTDTLYVGTGQNYTGHAGDFDTVLALATGSGALRWKRQMTDADTWRVLCLRPDIPPGYCPGQADGSALDFDLGAIPNIFTVGGRRLVGIGQKSGIYHVLDALTGEIVWQRQLSEPSPNGGLSGIEWGASYDGSRLYVATWQANPGTLFALDPADGDILWSTPNPADGCTWGGASASPDLCQRAHTPAVTSSPGLVWEGSMDGKLRAYSSATGAVLWQYDTVRDFDGVNGLPGRGSSVSGNGGTVVADGMVFVQSGYYPFYPTDRGWVLLAFRLR